MEYLVTIIMGIYNCEATLAPALDSLLHQTFSGWKLILCDDGSTDGTRQVARRYVQRDRRIQLLVNRENRGLNETLNRCLALVDTPYTARMDGDDLSLPDRLRQELEVLEHHPEFAFVSTEMIYFDERGDWGVSASRRVPRPEDFVRETPFCHGPAMLRTQALRQVGGYSVDPRLLRVEDYHLWLKLYAAGFRGCNILTPLYKMRDDRNACRRRKYRYRWNESYVRLLAVRMLHLPACCALAALRPLLVGLLPERVYRCLHQRRLRAVLPQQGTGEDGP